ncbi:MAG TPA: hypothetical protein VGF54_13435, partial [Streptosporangiaceae bacterium]
LRIVPGPAAVASAFSRSAQLALLANLGLMALALILVLALPRDIPVSLERPPGRGSPASASGRRE